MKLKGLKILILLLTISFAGFSQQFNFGVKFGGNSTSLTSSNVPGYGSTSKLKLHVGGMAHYQIYKGIGLQIEALYSAKGDDFYYDKATTFIESTVHVEQKLNYLNIPVMFKYTLGNPKNGFHVDAGVSFNTLLSGKYKSELSYQNPNNADERLTQDYDPGLMTMSTDNCILFGLGLISNGIVFDFRYEIGKSAIYESEPKVYNRTFMISAGYFF